MGCEFPSGQISTDPRSGEWRRHQIAVRRFLARSYQGSEA
jgi:hypothetical protein